jgi:membrane-bound serine protease (ClpP class)
MSFAALVVLLLVAGLALLLLELLVIPGFGVVGFMGIGALVAGVGVAWWHLGPLESALAFLSSAGTVGLMLWYLPRSRVARAMVLEEVQRGTAALPTPGVYVGVEGVAATALRPAGVVQFAEVEVDVVSEGLFVDAGTRVRVTRVEGARVFVEPISNYQGG